MDDTKKAKVAALNRLANDRTTTEFERSNARNIIVSIAGAEGLTTPDKTTIIVPKSREIQVAAQPKFTMPTWVDDIYRNPCPYQSIVDRLLNRMFSEVRDTHLSYEHTAWTKFWKRSQGSNDYGSIQSVQIERDEFVFEQFKSRANFHAIRVVLPGTTRKSSDWVGQPWQRAHEGVIEIFCTSGSGGWRHGPWWDRLDKLTTKWCEEADALDVIARRAKADREQAERDAKNDLFSSYVSSTK